MVRSQLMLPLLPGKRTVQPCVLGCARKMAGPVALPCWPCMTLSPFERVWLAPVKNTFSPTS